MEPTLEEVRRELTEIYEELLNIPANDYDRRAELKERQNELRQISHRLLEGQPLHDAENLRAAYDRLHKVRDTLLERHLSHSSTSVGDAGIDGAFTDAINRAMDEGMGLDEVERRMKEILDQLKSSG